jgi:hypothetical protein
MLLQDAPPDTSVYMIAGYTVFFIVGAVYLASLFIRRRNLERDLRTLESLKPEDMPSPPAQARARRASRKPSATKPKTAKRKPGAKKVSRRR